MALGLGILKLGPQAFWRMTPRELGAAVRGLTGTNGIVFAPNRGELADLMALFPDAATPTETERAKS